MIAMDREPSAAVELFEESLAEYEAAGDETGRLLPLNNLAANALARGDNELAISLLRERVAGTRGRDTYSLALAIGLLGFALAANGESEEARQSFEESLARLLQFACVVGQPNVPDGELHAAHRKLGFHRACSPPPGSTPGTATPAGRNPGLFPPTCRPACSSPAPVG